MSLVLIGPMAAGKTSIGKLLAERLKVPFVDTDERIVSQHGPIPDFFAAHGEAAFREVEEAAVRDALEPGLTNVIALGGGAVLSEKTRGLLPDHLVVLLMTDAETVLSRANLEKRPLLKDDPGAWQRILDERLPLYTTLADVTMFTARLPKDRVADEIVTWLKNQEH